jgi:hypothetical protein
MKPDHEAAKMRATGVLATGDGGIEQERDANVARAYLDLTQQLAGARALLERGAQLGIQSCAIEGDEWGTFAASCRAFLARTKGQNE